MNTEGFSQTRFELWHNSLGFIQAIQRAKKLEPYVLAYLFANHFLFGSLEILKVTGIEYYYFIPQKISVSLVGANIDFDVWMASTTMLSLLLVWFAGKRRRFEFAVLGSTGIGLTALSYWGPTPFSAPVAYLLFADVTLSFLFLTHDNRGSGRGLTFVSATLIFLMSYMIGVEASAATYHTLHAFNVFSQIGLKDANIELQLSFAASSLSPWLLVAFLFSWLWGPLLHKLPWARTLISESMTPKPTDHRVSDQNEGGRASIVLDPRLFLIIAGAVFIGYYPYFHNPPWLVGTDAYWRYYDPLLRINAGNGSAAFLQALKERHPLPLILMYAAQAVFQTSPFEVVRLAPVAFLLTLGASAWWFMGRGKDVNKGVLAFLSASFSISAAIGMYTSILANWMALVVWTAFFAYVGFVGDKMRLGIGHYLTLLLLSTLILFIHPWTWGVFAVSIAIFALLSFVSRSREVRSGLLFLSIIAFGLLFAYVSVTILAGIQGWRVLRTIDLYASALGDPSRFGLFWNQVALLTQRWAPFFSPLYLTLSILGAICVQYSSLTAWRKRLILSWLAASAIGSVLAAPLILGGANGESQLWRVIFLAPFYIVVPFGIAWLTRLPYRFSKYGQTQEPSLTPKLWLVSLLVAGVLLAVLPTSARFLLVLALVPVLAALATRATRSDYTSFLSLLIGAFLLLAVFNYTTRSLSLLLLTPHVYRP